MQDTQSQGANPKGVGHVCSSCGQMVESDLNTDLYEALKGLVEYYDIILVGEEPNCHVKAIEALAKADGK